MDEGDLEEVFGTKLSLRRGLSRMVLDTDVDPEVRCLRTDEDLSSLVAGFRGAPPFEVKDPDWSISNSSEVRFRALRSGVNALGGDDEVEASLSRACSLGRGGTSGDGGSSGEGDEGLTASEGCKKMDPCGLRGYKISSPPLSSATERRGRIVREAGCLAWCSSLSSDSPSTASIVQGLSGGSFPRLVTITTAEESSSSRRHGRWSSSCDWLDCLDWRCILSQCGVASSPTPTRPLRSMLAGSLAGVRG